MTTIARTATSPFAIRPQIERRRVSSGRVRADAVLEEALALIHESDSPPMFRTRGPRGGPASPGDAR